MQHLTRRTLLGGAASMAALGMVGCSRQTSISTDPNTLVLWYWNRSIAPSLLASAATQIPSTSRKLRADIIGGNFDTKLRTSLAGGAYIPDLTAINSNVSIYFPNENQFVDFNEHGAKDVKDDYYAWKWQFCVTPSGRMPFWPMDTGPTGFYYRNDLVAKAGLDGEPDAMSQAIKTWDGFIEFGSKLRTDAKVATVATANVLYSQFINASAQRYFTQDNKPVWHDDGNPIRKAWDVAVAAIKAKITGNLQVAADQNAGWTNGTLAGHIEAVWWSQILGDTAPDTKGKWRLASQPEKPGNSGGSFLAVPHTCKDPQAAYEFCRWLTTPQNQATSYNEVQLFPSSPKSFDLGMKGQGGGFYGDQDVLEFFSTAAKGVPITYISPYESLTTQFGTELTNVEAAGKNPEQAWDDAVSLSDALLKKRGEGK